MAGSIHFEHDINTVTAVTPDANTAVGNLILVGAYVEPQDEATPDASYGSISGPAGFTLASWTPVTSNDANLITASTSRFYLWWGSTPRPPERRRSRSPASSVWWEIEVVRVTGGPVSGDPFADTPAAGGTVDSSSFPNLSIVTGGPNSLAVSWTTSWMLFSVRAP